MRLSVKTIAIAAAFAAVATVFSVPASFIAHAEKAKAPPPTKDAPTKSGCTPTSSTNKAKSADKAFDQMDCYIRGRVTAPTKGEPTEAPAPSNTLAK